MKVIEEQCAPMRRSDEVGFRTNGSAVGNVNYADWQAKFRIPDITLAAAWARALPLSWRDQPAGDSPPWNSRQLQKRNRRNLHETAIERPFVRQCQAVS